MFVAKNKTTENDSSVTDYLNKIADANKRADCTELVKSMSRQLEMKPKMWGTGIVGFGSYHYKYESGHEGDAPLTGLAARANAITLYIANFPGKEALLKKLGKVKTSKVCVYIKKLEDVNKDVLNEIISKSFEYMKQKYLN